MKASVFSLATADARYQYNAQGELMTETAEGWRVLPGYLRETDANLPIPEDANPERHIIMGEPGKPILDGAVSIATIGDPEWYVAQLLAVYPDIAPYVLEREYELEGERRRQKMARSLPEGAVLVGQNLVGRIWAGDDTGGGL